MANLYSTFVTGGFPEVPGTATNTTVTFNVPATAGTANVFYGQGLAQVGAETAQNPTQYDWQMMQRLQQQWAEQQRQQEEWLEQMRQLYMFGQARFRTPEPEKLETKELSASDRERLLEALPF